MNAKEALTNFEIVALEELVFGDDCECESRHLINACSNNVVAVKSTKCGPTLLICENSRKWNVSVIERDSVRCGCTLHPSECWTIRPI